MPYSTTGPGTIGATRSSLGYGSIAAIVVAIGLFFAIVLGLLVYALGSTPDAYRATQDNVSDSRPSSVVALEDRPSMAELLERVDSMREYYTAMEADGSLHTLVPRTQDSDYLEQFLKALRDLETRIGFLAGDVSSTNVEMLDQRIRDLDDEVTALEEHFLAGEDFDGDAVDLTQLSNDELAYLVASFTPHKVDGDYWQAVEELAALWDMEIVWVDGDDGSSMCYWIHHDDEFDVQGYYCELEPHLIYINTASSSFRYDIRSLAVVMITLHEMGHAAITRICGTTEPAIMGSVSVEAVTNSYTVLYLGGDWDILGDGAPDDYIITPETDEIARAIHAGQCR